MGETLNDLTTYKVAPCYGCGLSGNHLKGSFMELIDRVFGGLPLPGPMAIVGAEVNMLIRAGNALEKGMFTVAGRSLQKHGNRIGSLFPRVSGNIAAINAQGEAVLKGILTNPKVVSITRHHAKFGNILEYRIPGGQGARFSADGKTFLHFIEP